MIARSLLGALLALGLFAAACGGADGGGGAASCADSDTVPPTIVSCNP